MSWSARLKAALSGDVSGADVAAMLAATAPLASLEQELANRRLAAEIDHTGHEWRVCTALAPIAAPLWLAEVLVTLAQSLVETEAQDHPDRPSDLSPVVHAVAASSLQPVENIIAEVSAALRDPARPSGLTAPFTVGPRGTIAAYQLPVPIPVPYARGLLLAATRVRGAAQVALDDAESLVRRAPAPGWLTSALQRVGGELRAVEARLGMDETRLTPLLREPHANEDALEALCTDLWEALNTALVIGQMVREPHLLPGAPAAPPASPSADAPPQTYRQSPQPNAPQPIVPPAPISATTVRPSQPSRREAAPERPVALPTIGDGVRDVSASVPRDAEKRASTSPLPSTPTTSPDRREGQPLALPQIGEVEPQAGPVSSHKATTHRAQPAKPTERDESPAFQLPRIGPDA